MRGIEEVEDALGELHVALPDRKVDQQKRRQGVDLARNPLERRFVEFESVARALLGEHEGVIRDEPGHAPVYKEQKHRDEGDQRPVQKGVEQYDQENALVAVVDAAVQGHGE